MAHNIRDGAGGRATLWGPTTATLLSILPLMEGQRRWVTGGLSFEPTPHNIELFTLHLGARDMRQAPRAEPRPQTKKGRGASPRNSQPFPHQSAALEHFGDKNVMALFMEQGTGKTKTSLDWADDLFGSGEITGALIVSRRGVHRQWIVSEIPRHSYYASEAVAAYWGQKGAAYWEKAKPPGEHLEFAAINWDGLKTPRGWAWASEFMERHRGRLLIIGDEAQDMKNYQSERHKAMERARRFSSHRAVLTGTPIAKDLTDEWAILRWLDPAILGVKYVSTFRAQYCVMGGFQNRQVIGHKSIDEFRRRTAPYVFRVKKTDIGLLPKQYSDWAFDLSKLQKEMIREVKADLKAILGGKSLDLSQVGPRLLRIQQITNGFISDETGTVHRLCDISANPRIREALDYLEGEDGKAIVWCRFREDIAMVGEVLQGAGHSFRTYVGGMKDAEQQDVVKDFLSEDGARFLLATSAASTGLNLQGTCNRALYYSEGWNAVDRWQKEDRIDRIGTKGFTTHTDLIARGGIDRAIMANRLKKKGTSDAAIEGLPQAGAAPGKASSSDVAAIFEAFLEGD